jgi:hypothetical protein
LLIKKIKLGQNPEAFWEDVYGMMEDCLLKAKDTILHCGEEPKDDEPFNPSLLNVAVVIWIQGIHPGLPNVIKRKYARELRESTIFSLRDEICANISTLLADTDLAPDNASISRATFQQQSRFMNCPVSSRTQPKVCCICQTANRRPNDHFFQTCPYLPA